MSQNLSNPLDATHNTPTAAEPKPVHIDLRLRAVDQSDRSIVSNITGVHLGSGFAFIDFGFIEHAALNDVTRAARSGEQKNPTLDGRLECRIAMGLGDLMQLARQIDQVISSANKSRANTASGKQDPLALDPAAVMQ
ncbi:MAG: hypothetical protein RLZZ20_2242 [Pseudomonadota bacterium]|jgi:hypothetical protein